MRAIPKTVKVLAALAATTGALIVWAAPAGATHVTPTVQTGNFSAADCPAGTIGREFFQASFTGQFIAVNLDADADPEAFIKFTRTAGAAGAATEVSFEIQGATAEVVAVKAQAVNVYDYPSPGATSDTGLRAPPGPGGQLQEISHITVCFVDVAFAAEFQSLRATRYGKAVTLRWRTASEVDTLGYNVYRSYKGKRVKLNKRLIPAGSLVGNAAGPYRYSFRARLGSARLAAASRYWVQEIEQDGSRNWYGPVRAASAT